MNRKYKLSAIVLASALLVSLAGCGETVEPSAVSSEASSAENSSSVAVVQEVSAAAPSEATSALASSDLIETVKVSADEWQAIYKQLLLNPKTFQSENAPSEGYAYLMDVDGNGVPELYFCYGPVGLDYLLTAVYDASTGALRENHFTDSVWFGTSLVVNTKTGERGLRGISGGSMMRTDFFLKPNMKDLTFEKVDISTTGIEWEEERVARTIQISEDCYKELPAAEQPKEPLQVGGNRLPDEATVCAFLGLDYVAEAGNGNAQELLSKLPYVGGECTMSNEQAQAFLAVIEKAQNQHGADSQVQIALSNGGDGIPMLWIAEDAEYEMANVEVWQWDGKSAQKIVFQNPLISEIQLHQVNNELYLVGSEFTSSIQMTVTLAHRLSQGQLQKEYRSSIIAFFYENEVPFKDVFQARYPQIYLDFASLEKEFEQTGWQEGEAGLSFMCQCYDGVPESKADPKSIAFWESLTENTLLIGGYDHTLYTDANKVISALKEYVA